MRHCQARPDAAAQIRGSPDAPKVSGVVRFYQSYGNVLVVADISGLPQDNPSGFFALHIHDGDSCSGDDFSQTGSHYNPAGNAHPMHAGDLPPLMLCRGGAHLAVRTDRFRVQDILGRTVVIHSGPDDFRTQPAGASGVKIACGVITKN